MKFLATCILAGVAGAPMVSAHSYSSCLPYCTISTYGTPWNYAYVRPTPCNTHPPLTTLYDGDVVYNLGVSHYACSYTYNEVWVPSIGKTGWVSADLMDCGNNPPAPAAAVAAMTTSTSSGQSTY